MDVRSLYTDIPHKRKHGSNGNNIKTQKQTNEVN